MNDVHVFLCSYKESKLKNVSSCAWFNGQFGESDCLCRNGKYTIKLWAPRGLGSANLSEDWWFLASLERGRLRGKQDKIDGKEESGALLKGSRENEQLMFVDWSDYNIFRSTDHDKGLLGVLPHGQYPRWRWSHLSGKDCREASVYWGVLM